MDIKEKIVILRKREVDEFAREDNLKKPYINKIYSILEKWEEESEYMSGYDDYEELNKVILFRDNRNYKKPTIFHKILEWAELIRLDRYNVYYIEPGHSVIYTRLNENVFGDKIDLSIKDLSILKRILSELKPAIKRYDEKLDELIKEND